MTLIAVEHFITVLGPTPFVITKILVGVDKNDPRETHFGLSYDFFIIP